MRLISKPRHKQNSGTEKSAVFQRACGLLLLLGRTSTSVCSGSVMMLASGAAVAPRDVRMGFLSRRLFAHRRPLGPRARTVRSFIRADAINSADVKAEVATTSENWTTHRWEWQGHQIKWATAGCGKPVILVHGEIRIVCAS